MDQQNIIITVIVLCTVAMSVIGTIYYINNKRRWEEEEFNKILKKDIDTSLLKE